MNEDHASQNVPAKPPGTSWRQRASIIGAAAMITVAGFYTARSVRDAQTGKDATCQWRLQFPGTPPGATFKTRPGDDPSGILHTVLPEDTSARKSLLAGGGTVTLRLDCSLKRYIPLPTRIRWWQMDHRWRPRVANAGFGFPTVGIRQVSPSSYEVFRTLISGGSETIAGPVEGYGDAESAMLAEVVKMTEEFQNGTRVEGRVGMFPEDP
jgi:hypothetical protein